MAIPLGNHRVPAAVAGATLVEALAALAKRPSGEAWQEANELVRARHVQVNGNTIDDGARLVRAQDVIKVLPHAAAKAATPADVRIVYVDEHLLVVEKPPGVTTMRESDGAGDGARVGGGGRVRDARIGRRNRQATLETMLQGLLAKRAGESGKRAGAGRGQATGRGGGVRRGAARHSRQERPLVLPVHRLDRDTSGLMLFARTADAQRALTAAFKARRIGRSYLAVAHGHPPAMTIISHIVPDRGDGLRGSAEAWGKDPAAGQRAVTHVEPLEAIGPYALVRCALETGRTHQIRIHLSEAGHMLCGEKEYVRDPGGSKRHDDSGAPRQALHAERLGFEHPVTGRAMRFELMLPADLAGWLQSLRRTYAR